MRRGRMTYRLRVFSPDRVKNGFGEERVNGWREVGIWWAERMSLVGRKAMASGEIVDSYSACFRIDDHHAPKVRWQLECDGERFAIEAIEPDRFHGMLTLKCSSVNL